MSLTPKDSSGNRGEPRTRTDVDRETGQSVRARVAAAFSTLSARVRRAIGRLHPVTTGETGKPDAEDTGSMSDTTDNTSPPVPVEAETAPSTARSHRSRTDEIDLVAERTDGTLTIRDPDTPEAHVESDTWIPVER